MSLDKRIRNYELYHSYLVSHITTVVVVVVVVVVVLICVIGICGY